MKISNLKIYDLEESIIASGYPMRTEAEMREVEDSDIKRIKNLVKASNGNGAHGQWLTGVRVAFDLTCSNKMWVEAERYRFLEFVSSQSTMHRISKFELKNCCNEYVDPFIIARCEQLQEVYLETKDKEDYLRLLYSIPSGFELTARLTTNYRCLLNIWIQRHDHRLPEWRAFCEQLLELPYFKELVDAYYSKERKCDSCNLEDDLK
jgi:hypothetical protein